MKKLLNLLSFMLVIILVLSEICVCSVFADDCEYSVDDIQVTVNGSPCSNIFTNGDICVKLPVKNSCDNLSLIVAHYCKDRLLNLSLGKYNSNSKSLESQIKIDNGQVDNTYIKIFLWDDKLNPILANPKVLIPKSDVYVMNTFKSNENFFTSNIKPGDTFVINDGYANIYQSGTAQSSSFLQYNFSNIDSDSIDYLMLEAKIRNSTIQNISSLKKVNLFMLCYEDSSGVNQYWKSGTFSYGKLLSTSVLLTSQIWNKINLYVNFNEHIYNLYVNNTLVGCGNIPLEMKNSKYWRIEIPKSDEEGSCELTDLYVYKSKTPLDLSSGISYGNGVFDEKVAKNLLSSCTALSPYNDVIYCDQTKKDTDVPCILYDNEVLISQDTFEKLFGANVELVNKEINIGNTSFVVGENVINISGESKQIEVAPQIKDGNLMLPVIAYGNNVLKDKFYDDSHGMFVVSKSNINKSANWKEANNYLFFNRYNAEQITSKLKEKWGSDLTSNDAHPRILATVSDFDRIKELINQNDTYITEWYDIIKSYADESIKSGLFTDIYTYDISSGTLAGKNSKGKKVSVSKIMMNCALSCGMLYNLSESETEKKKYSDICINLMKQFCDFPDWYPGHHLEIGEMDLGIAIGYDWFYDSLSEEDKQYIYERARINGLKPAREVFYGTSNFDNNWFAKTTTNWGGVVNSGIIALSLATAEKDLEYNIDTLVKSLRSLEYSVYSVAPDGAWYEGPNYWRYYFNHLAYAMGTYESCLGEIYEGVYHKGMLGMCLFKDYFTLPNGYSATYNDCTSGKVESLGRMYVAKAYSDGETVKSYLDYYDKYLKGYQKDSLEYYAVTNMLWYNPDCIGTTSSQKLDQKFADTEFLSIRGSWNDDNSLYFMTDGGSSEGSHSHLDTGSFQLMLNGIHWAKDLGREELTYSRVGTNYLQNAGLSNNLYYRRNAEGHNMVVINPKAGELDILPTVTSVVCGPYRSDSDVYAYIDLTDAYGSNKVNKYIRGYLVSDNRRSLTVRDEIELTNDASIVCWFMNYVSGGEVTSVTSVGNDKKVNINKNSQDLEMIFHVEKNGIPTSDFSVQSVASERLYDIYGLNSNGENVSIKGMEASSTENGNKLRLKLKSGGKITITVKMYIKGEEISEINIEDINGWGK